MTPLKVFKYFIGMGESQFGLRSMESRQSSRIRLPDGDDLPSNMEDAPINRISKNKSFGTSTAESAGSRRKVDRKSLRGFALSFFSVRKIAKRRIHRSSSQGPIQGSGAWRNENNSCTRSYPTSNATETESRVENFGSESRTITAGQVKVDGSKLPPRNSEEASKNCFLDKTRICESDCMAFDTHWKSQPCSIIRALKPSTNFPVPIPPKVKL